MTDTITSDPSGYVYSDTGPAHTQRYLWEPVKKVLQENRVDRLFELGCGNGAFAFELANRGIAVTGVDPSEEGIRIANQRKEQIGAGPVLSVGNAYDDLASIYGTFPCVLSLEVVEHVYFPRKYAKCVYDLLEPGGGALISTPYHSYWKNLALAVSGRMDAHFTVLWDHGHIKFWSVKTLTALFDEQGMHCEAVQLVGRFPWLAKSMILMFRKDA